MAMVLGAFTFGDALLTVLEIGFLILWIWIAVGVVFDVFRSHDLSNWGKAMWLLFIFVLPLLGVLAYLIVRGHTMHEHQQADQTRAVAFQRFVQTGTSTGPADDLNKLADLRERGILSDDEFARAKAKVLG
jgi:Phospholipase_D-nuclease N-terminal/Short C-terminal domain